MKKILALFLTLLATPAFAASLLPNGKQQFFNANGYPLSGGSVYFYIPGTTTPKDTWQDSASTILNTNPVLLDAGGFATIYGSGSYREVVKDALGNTVYDQLTSDTSSTQSSWGGTAGGSANAITLSSSAFSANDGQIISWKVQYTNTGPATLTINGSTYGILRDTPTGQLLLSGGEMVAGSVVSALYDVNVGKFHLLNPTKTNTRIQLSAASLVDLGASGSNNILISGTGPITSFGSSASPYYPIYFVQFNNTITVTNSTSIVSPTGTDLIFTPGSYALVTYLGSGSWRILDYNIPYPPTHFVIGSGSGNATIPSNTTRIYVRMIGGGGGGGGVGSGSGNGGTATQTCFNSICAAGGFGGAATNTAYGGVGGLGGTGGAGTASIRIPGGYGNGGVSSATSGATVATSAGGSGCSSPFGGAGASDNSNSNRMYGIANTGSGGAGASAAAANIGSAGGGGCGEYVEFQLSPPILSSIPYSVGVGGAAGAAGSGTAGGVGASGMIILDFYYN